MTFSLDTSFFLNAWVRRYPPDVFPGVWSHVEGVFARGDAVASIEVYRELETKDDDVFAWCKARKDSFLEIDDSTQNTVTAILTQSPFLLKNIKGRNAADPFVIAIAEIHGLVVVSEEGPGSEGRPKIPDICAGRNIDCCNTLEFLRRTGLQLT